MYDRLTIISLFFAVVMTGLMAGFFSTYSFNINYAMLELNAAEYVRVQSLFNENVRHFGFFSLFFGSAILLIINSILQCKYWKSISFLSITLAALLYILVIIVFTRVFILPINYTVESWVLMAVPENWVDMRDVWNQANLIRSVVAICVFVLTMTSLYLFSCQKGEG